MITIHSATSHEPIYPAIQKFAQVAYWSKHKLSIHPQPDVFCFASKNDVIVGCSGIYAGTRNALLTTERWIDQDQLSQFNGEKKSVAVKLENLEHVPS